MNINERSSLLNRVIGNEGLSTTFAIICILDVFGVFPVVALPKAIIDCGLYGILVVVLVASVQVYTANLLGKCWIIAEEICPTIQRKNRYPYAAIAEVTYGRKLASFVTFLLDLTIFGGGIPNLIVASQNLQLVGLRISDGSLNISYCYWIMVVGTILCPVLWLGSPKDMKCLCSLSVIIVTSVFFLICGCLVFSSNEIATSNTLEGDQVLWRAMVKAYGIMVFQFDIHPTILTIQVDMKDKTKLSRAILGGFTASLLMFGVIALLAFLNYGTTIKPSILETLPTTIPLHFAAVLVAIQLCLTSAISNSALYQQMEDCMNISREFNPKRCVLRTSLTVLSIVIAESVPRFDLVMSLIGGTLTGPLVFILPPLFYLKLKSLEAKHHDTLEKESFQNIISCATTNSEEDVSRYLQEKFRYDFRPSISFTQKYERSFLRKHLERIVCVLIMIVSIVLTLGTTYINFFNVLFSYSNLTQSCIYNISMTLIYL